MSFPKTIFVLAILAISFTAVSCEKAEDKLETPTISAEQQAKDEERQRQFEQDKQELNLICTKKTPEMTGIEFARCKDYKDNAFIYEEFLSGIPDSNFSYLPEVCKRTLKELSGNEMIDCLAEEPESEEY